jgi:hypothetical protein
MPDIDVTTLGISHTDVDDPVNCPGQRMDDDSSSGDTDQIHLLNATS